VSPLGIDQGDFFSMNRLWYMFYTWKPSHVLRKEKSKKEETLKELGKDLPCLMHKKRE